jgi:dTDP-4-amino-4,6-dideoxygalactose transaminase
MPKKIMQVPLLDLKQQYQAIQDEILSRLDVLFKSQQFILGQEVEACEKLVADYCGVPFGCGVSSGTDALLMALMSEGIGPGDEVLTTPYSFFATSGCIARVGAKAVFTDIDPVTFNMDVSGIEKKISRKTKAIMPVHLYGQCADMAAIMQAAKKHGLAVIEDAAQAIGAGHGGIRAGAWGDYGCFSFFPSKNLGCFGDGGMVVCRDAEKQARLKALRNHGSEKKYYHGLVGGNFRLDAVQAAVVSIKLKHLDGWTAKRQANAGTYQKLFENTGLVRSKKVVLPVQVHDRHVYNQYVIRAQRRDELMEHLKKRGVGCEVYYPLSLHLQECFKFWGYKAGDFPESEKASRETLALPIYPELAREQQEYVVAQIAEFFGE